MRRPLHLLIVIVSPALWLLCPALGQAQSNSTPSSAACGDWSPKFDRVDDPATLRILREHQKMGWDALSQQGNALGVNLARQIADGQEQLERTRAGMVRDEAVLKQMGGSYPQATAGDCEGIEQRGQPWMKTACDLHKRQNDSLAIEGMVDLLKCRAGSTVRAPVLPAGTQVISTFTVQVTAAKDSGTKTQSPPCPPNVHPMPAGRIINIGKEQAAKIVVAAEGEYLMLRFADQGATGFQLEPGNSVLEKTKGIYHLPDKTTGLVKAVKPGTAKVSILGPTTPPPPPGKPTGGNPADATSNADSGYFVTGTNFFAASGSWEVPQLWGFGNRSSGTWVGVDGLSVGPITATTLIQAGTIQESDSGFLGIGESQSYWPFWEIVPQLEAQQIPYQIFPGDLMFVLLRSIDFASTTAGSSNPWDIIVTDSTQGWNFVTRVEYTGNLATVEWIEEDPTSCFLSWCNVGTLADYQSVTFEGASMYPFVQFPAPTFNPPPLGALAAFPPQAFRSGFPALVASDSITMVQSGSAISTPSNPDGDGDGFTIAFGSAVPPAPGPFVTTTTLPNAVVGWPYSFTLQQSGARAPQWFSNLLPSDGLSLNYVTGIISGTPVNTGSFNIGVWVVDVANPGTSSQLQNLSLKVVQPWQAGLTNCQFFPGLGAIVCF